MTERTLVPDKLHAYLLQVRHMLYELITLDLETVVSVEAFDDVGVKSGEDIIAEQIKSVTTGGNPLADRAEVFWKTVFNWCSYLAEGHLSVHNLSLKFIVISEKNLPCGKIPQSFADASNATEAKKALDEAYYALTHSEDGKEKEIPDSYKRYAEYIFSSENEHIVLAVIQAISITVYDGDYDSRLVERFNSQQVPAEYSEELLIYMLGWVSEEVHKQTKLNKPAYISAKAFHDELASQIRGRNLNTILSALSTEPSNSETTGEVDRQDNYIKQLGFIDLDPTEIFTAANDFLRTKAEKVLWSQRGIVTQANIDDYNERVTRRWNIKKRLNDFQNHASEETQGQTLYYNTSEDVSCLRLQGCDPPPFFGSGTLHELANEPKIGWHPRYEELLQQEAADGQNNE